MIHSRLGVGDQIQIRLTGPQESIHTVDCIVDSVILLGDREYYVKFRPSVEAEGINQVSGMIVQTHVTDTLRL